MTGIHYDGTLAALPETGLRTPAYYHAVEVITEDIRNLKAVLGTSLIMRLSDCPLPDVLSRLPEDARFGVVTGARPEMNMVIAWATDHAYVAAPALDVALARAGLGANHRFFIENPDQITLLAGLRGRRVVQPVILTVQGARPDRGMTPAALAEAVALAQAAGIPIGGFAQADAVLPDGGTRLRALAAVADALCPEGALLLIPGPYEGPAQGAGVNAYRAAIAALPPRFCVVHVAGAAIFARSGVMATQVLHVAQGAEAAVARCDIGMAQAFLLTEAAGPLRIASRAALLGGARREATPCVLVGSGGAVGEVFARLPFLPETGEVIVFDHCGAMVRTFSPVQHGGAGEVPVFLLGESAAAGAAA